MVLARYQGERLNGWIESKLADWMGLEINREKTRVIDLRQQGVKPDFLGYTFGYDRDLKGRQQSYLNVTISNKALKGERQKLREMTNAQHCFVPLPQMIEGLNGHLMSWANYFSYGYPRKGSCVKIHIAYSPTLLVEFRRNSLRDPTFILPRGRREERGGGDETCYVRTGSYTNACLIAASICGAIGFWISSAMWPIAPRVRPIKANAFVICHG